MTAETWLWTLFWFGFGAAAGSFCVLAGLRIPQRKSVVRPPSACPSCGARISGIDLVPIVGWLWRRGACRHCRARISPIYVLGEAGTGLLFALLYLHHSSVAEWIGGMLLVAMLVALTVSDLKYRLLPDRIVYPSFAVFVLYQLLVAPGQIWSHALGLLIGGGMLLAVSWVSVKANRPAMGGGDIKLMALLGWLLGFERVLLVILLSSVLGLLVGFSLIAAGKMRRDTFLPFGPFIAAAALFAWMWGQDVVDRYLNHFVYM